MCSLHAGDLQAVISEEVGVRKLVAELLVIQPFLLLHPQLPLESGLSVL